MYKFSEYVRICSKSSTNAGYLTLPGVYHVPVYELDFHKHYLLMMCSSVYALEYIQFQEVGD